MKQYFENEMHYLRDAGKRFSERHPLQAGHLGAAGQDPDVERLLEGFAFLTAKLQRQADAWAPVLTEQLASAISPDMMAPLPSATIVQLKPQSRILRASTIVPRGLRCHIPNLNREDIVFKTTEECTISPLSKIDSRIEKISTNEHKITLKCTLSPQCTFHHLLESRTRFFISGIYGQSSNLLLSILRHTDQIFLSMGKRRINLPQNRHVSYLNLHSEPALLGRSNRASPGSSAMRDYILLPERFCFFDVIWPNESAIRSLGMRAITCDSFDLTFVVKHAPPLPSRIDPSTFRLHCVPAVNIFETSAIPLTVDGFSTQRLVRAEAHASTEDALVHSVLRAESISLADGEHHQYIPHAQMTQKSSTSTAGYYVLHRKPPVSGPHSDTYISLHHLDQRQDPFEEQVLSLQLLCTNHHRASHIPSETKIRVESFAGLQSAISMTPTSLACDALLDTATVWMVLGQMRQLRSFSDPAEKIRQRIDLLCHPKQIDAPRHNAKKSRIAGISDLKKEHVHRIWAGIPQAHTKWSLSLLSESFSSEGDGFIFAHIVEAMLSDFASFNQPYSMNCQILPTNVRYSWDSRIW